MTAAGLRLRLAREALGIDRVKVHVRRRAAVLLARQGLELGVDRYVARFDCEGGSMRGRLVVVRETLNPRELGELAGFCWGRLSEAVHAEGYELGLGAGEVAALLDDVERVVGRLEEVS